MDERIRTLLHEVKLDPDLALEFFVTFSRFEFALVATGFVRERRGTAEVDWDCYVTHLEQIDPTGLEEILDAGHPLLEKPPMKLVVGKNGMPCFRSRSNGGGRDIRGLILSVRTARNNLFHGAKNLTPANQPARNKEVVSAALQVLNALLRSPSEKKIRDVFYSRATPNPPQRQNEDV